MGVGVIQGMEEGSEKPDDGGSSSQRICAGALGFAADERQAAVLDSTGEARDFELYAAVGEIDGAGGEGGASGVDGAGEPGAGGESFGAAERGVRAQGGGVSAQAGREAARAMAITRSRWCCRTGAGLWGCRERRRRCAGFRRCRCC